MLHWSDYELEATEQKNTDLRIEEWHVPFNQYVAFRIRKQDSEYHFFL